jgi:hypothetical protein
MCFLLKGDKRDENDEGDNSFFRTVLLVPSVLYVLARITPSAVLREMSHGIERILAKSGSDPYTRHKRQIEIRER